MPKLLKKKVSFNIRKAAYWVMVASWLQIIASVILVVSYFAGVDFSTQVMVVVLIPVVVAGNILLMRNAWNILDYQEQWAEVMSTMQGEAELNRKLRAQRHDFINHLQVVHSLIQLEEFNEAGDYIQKVYNDIRQVGEVLRTANPAVNALLAAKSVDAQKKGVVLKYHITARLEKTGMEDWKLCRVLSNLLDNAIHETAKCQGEVHLNLREDINGLYFAVENDGNPIPEDIKARIFEPGFTTKGDQGTGMGLFIVRETLGEHGGTIDLESDEESTRFYGFIPHEEVNTNEDRITE